MSEELKIIRLSKAAKEFNIGLHTLVEFLAKKGHKVENNPNAKLTPEMYDMVVREFHSEKTVKEQASKIGLEFTGKKKTEEDNDSTVLTIDEEPEHEELIIKNTLLSYEPKENTAFQPKETLEKHAVREENTEEIQQVTVEEKTEEKHIEPEVISTVTEVSVPETTYIPIESIPESEEVQHDENDENSPQVKVIGRVNLDMLNLKTKPDRKSKEEKKKERDDQRKREKDEKSSRKQPEVSQEKPVKKQHEKQGEKKQHENKQQGGKHPEKIAHKEQKPVQTPAIPKVVETTDGQDDSKKPDDNFIATKYQKLEGPKIVNKIDLSEFQKPAKKPQPVASSSDESRSAKKKRKRIKKDTKPAGEAGAATSQQKPAPAPGQEVKKEKKEGGMKYKAHPRIDKLAPKAEVSDEEIQKQIKETLARLSPMGKSKASKHRREKRQSVSQQMQEEQMRQEADKRVLKVTEFVTANELATMMNVQVTQVISMCMSLGIFVSINQRLDAETLVLVAEEFGYKIEFVSYDLLEAIKEVEEEQENPEDLIPRHPIVTVMGHVDHGKTSLLDYIRHANVIAGEAGGITQHIGSYLVKLENGKKITFLDTPGHEAFTAMRARGAQVTDIAIIVIAADDKIMPQTIEAINHAQAAGVPLVFAINKIDKPGADPERIKNELAQMNLLVEEWGGKYQSQDISAKKGLNVELLLEKVLLEAELLELKANPKKRAHGTVIESSLDKGRGYVAKILVQDGTMAIGDMVLAGSTYGKVKAMYNERNQPVKEAGPSTPLLLLGLNGAPQAGDVFNVMPSEREAKDIATKRQQLQREQGLRTQKHITLDEIGRRIAIGDFKELNIIVKGDVDGSVEALSDSLLKLSNPQVQVSVIHKSVGAITESDVLLASASEAIIVGFQVRPSLSARKLAESEQIDIRLYSIIYNAINEIKDAIEGMLSPEIQEKIICNLEIRETFKITKVGTIAGCMCLDGRMNRQTKVRVIRDGIVVYTGKLESLKRFKDDVKEVVAGQDCGLNIENFNDIKVGDIIEGYEEFEVKRKL